MKLNHAGTHGGTITDNGTIEITGESGIVRRRPEHRGQRVPQVDSGTLLTLSNSAINGGTITDNGTIDVKSDSSINGAILNSGASDGRERR